MTKSKNLENDRDPKKTLVKCKAKGGEEITQEECEYLNQKDKAREKGREKPPEYAAGRDKESRLCINCDLYPPFNKM